MRGFLESRWGAVQSRERAILSMLKRSLNFRGGEGIDERVRLDTEKRSQFHSRTLLGPLFQSLGLVPHKPSQELPAWVLWDGVHELDTPCEMLVCNLGVRNVLFERGVSVLKEVLSGIGSYLANRLFNL